MVYVLTRVGLVLVGAAISAALYLAGVSGVLEPIRRSAGQISAPYLWTRHLVIIPVALAGGSFVTGLLLRPRTRRPVLETILFCPGTWLLATCPVLGVRDPVKLLMSLVPAVFLGLVSWVGVFAGYRLWVRQRRHPEGTCQTCGYSLIGNVSGRCPECGTAISTDRRPT